MASRPKRRSQFRRLTHSLRFQLTLWYTGILALILTGAAVLVFAGMWQTLRNRTDGFLAGESGEIATAATSTQDPQQAATEIMEDLSRAHPFPPQRRSATGHGFDVVFGRIVDAQSLHTLAVSPALAQQPTLTASLDSVLARSRLAYAGPSEERTLRVLTTPIQIAGRPAYLQLAVPWDPSDDSLKQLALELVLGVPIVLLLAAGGGWALIGRTLRPIDRIVVEAERLDAAAMPKALLPEAAETDGEIGRLVATLNRMTLRLQSAFEVQRRFAADASHELRTPLTILRGEMDLALTRPRSEAIYRGTLMGAVEVVDHMSRIVDGLSFLARRDARQLSPALYQESINLVDLGQMVVDDFMSDALERQITLQWRSASFGPCLTVEGNADQLQQLLRNLVHNALKYTPCGGRVEVSLGETKADVNHTVWIEVRDTGMGISAEDLPFIFDRFWRADRSRSSEGTGLGLAICAEIAAAHGGGLTATSEPGCGTKLRFQMPCRVSNAG